MIKTTAIYVGQRFGVKWLLLAFYLFVVTFGFEAFNPAFIFLFLLLLVLLFIFRLYDDLESKETDAGKENRIYTDAQKCLELRRVLAVAVPLVLAALFFINTVAAIIAAVFWLLNLQAYRYLYHKSNWRFLLPLLKYPLLCFLPLLITSGVSQKNILLAASLLPAFIIAEALADKNFRVSKTTLILLLPLCFLFFLVDVVRTDASLLKLILAPLICLPVMLKNSAANSYAFLAILLLIRLFYNYEF